MIAVACSDPEPTATPTPETTSTPVTLASLAITVDTNGQDVMENVSEAEASCTRREAGDAAYQGFLGTNLAAADRDASTIDPLFACLTDDNFILFGVGLIDAKSGGRTEESQTCILGLSRDHPEVVHVALGVGGTETDTGHPAQTQEYLQSLYKCLSEMEQVEFILGMWEAYSNENTMTPAELFELLTEDEITCMREAFGLTQEQFEAIVKTRLSGGGQSLGLGFGCVGEEFYVRVFPPIAASRFGGLTDESKSCLVDFAAAPPHFVIQVSTGPYDIALDPSGFAETAQDGFRMFSCLNDEELQRFQDFLPFAVAW